MWAFLVLEVLTSFSSSLGACTKKCDQPILLYDTLKCTPVFESTTDCCPLKYNCSHIVENAKSNVEKCYFEGKTYSSGQYVDDNNVDANCLAACYCRAGSPKYKRKTADFVCDYLECWHRFGVPLKPGCYLKFNATKCCSVETHCATPEGICTIKDKTIRFGELFKHPTKDCYRCVCEKGFIGEYKEPFCIKQKCISEIHSQNEVYRFCAPTYLRIDQCCPHMWICPKANDHIIKANKPSKDKCKFGKSLLNIGDKFLRIDDNLEKVSCNCSIPPYLTCIASIDYENFRSSDYTSSTISVLSLIISASALLM